MLKKFVAILNYKNSIGFYSKTGFLVQGRLNLKKSRAVSIIFDKAYSVVILERS